MRWLLGARRLAKLGVLAMNRRNATCLLEYNPRALLPRVDDKRHLRDLCERIAVPTPEVFAVIESHSQLRALSRTIEHPSDFVIKPARGSSGRGVLVIIGRDGNRFLRHNGQRMDLDDLRQHFSSILSGMYSLGGRPDQALIQYRVKVHPAFAPIAFKGVPDVRVIVYRGCPAMAMLRLPTEESGGRANLHQGGIGAGIDLDSGVTFHAVWRDQSIDRHPDTGASVIDRQIPSWGELLEQSRRIARATGLGYVGVDVVIDAERGPMLLEANARPGLGIQIANAQGLQPCLDAIDAAIRCQESAGSLPSGSFPVAPLPRIKAESAAR